MRCAARRCAARQRTHSGRCVCASAVVVTSCTGTGARSLRGCDRWGWDGVTVGRDMWRLTRLASKGALKTQVCVLTKMVPPRCCRVHRGPAHDGRGSQLSTRKGVDSRCVHEIYSVVPRAFESEQSGTWFKTAVRGGREVKGHQICGWQQSTII